jgi:hypothetical protein
MAISDQKWSALEIMALQHGGYVVRKVYRPDCGEVTDLLGAFTKIDDALLFLREHMIDPKTDKLNDKGMIDGPSRQD